MISKLQTKVRNLIQDNDQTTTESFIAGAGRTFTISQENATTVNQVTVAGTALGSGDYTYNSTTQVVTIASGSVASTDAVTIYYTFNKYSNAELLAYIKSALDWMATFNYHPYFDVYNSDADIAPIPERNEQSLISMICYVLIQPDYTEYRLPQITVKYEARLPKEQKIEKIIAKFKMCKEGFSGTIILE